MLSQICELFFVSLHKKMANIRQLARRYYGVGFHGVRIGDEVDIRWTIAGQEVDCKAIVHSGHLYTFEDETEAVAFRIVYKNRKLVSDRIVFLDSCRCYVLGKSNCILSWFFSEKEDTPTTSTTQTTHTTQRKRSADEPAKIPSGKKIKQGKTRIVCDSDEEEAESDVSSLLESEDDEEDEEDDEESCSGSEAEEVKLGDEHKVPTSTREEWRKLREYITHYQWKTNNYLWCAHCRQHHTKDDFSEVQKRVIDDSKRTCLRMTGAAHRVV
jgi:hypothetical protein